MKKRYVLAAMLSLMLAACGDDSASNPPQGNQLGSGGKKYMKLGACLGSPYDDLTEFRVLAKADVEDVLGELPKAYIVQDSAGNDQVMILKVSDYCDVDAELVYKHYGDTLSVFYDDIRNVTDCMCYSDHWFGLPAEYKGVKYFRFEGVTYEIVDSKEEGAL